MTKLTAKFIAYGAAALAFSLLGDLQAQDWKQGKATVRAVRGQAKYNEGNGVWVPLKVGKELKPGATIVTAADSTVDLFLGQNGPVVRVTPETTFGLEKLAYRNTGADTVIETGLKLNSGRILGNVKKLAAASRYEVKTPNGVAGVRGTDYDISVIPIGNGQFRLTVTSVNGTLVASGTNSSGEIVTAVINTGETWTPDDGIRTLPANVLQQIRQQIQTIAGIDVGDLTETRTTSPGPEVEQHVSPITGS